MGILGRLSGEDSTVSGGFGSERELAVNDLGSLSREGLFATLEQAEIVLANFWNIGAELDKLALMLGVSQRRASAIGG